MSVSLPKVMKVTVTDETGEGSAELVIRKMPLGRYAEFTTELAKIPKTVAGIVKMLFGDEGGIKDMEQGLKEDARMDQPEEKPEKPETGVSDDVLLDAILELPSILAQNWEDLIGLLSIASGLENEEINKLDIDEAVQIILAVIDVNNFFGIKDRYQQTLMKYATANIKQVAAGTVQPKPKAKRK